MSTNTNFHNFIDENGEVLILRRIPKSRVTDGSGKGKSFTWPTGVGSVVECPDWNPEPKCGGGLHGWPCGFGLGEGCDYDIIDDIWLVIGAKPEDVVGELDGGAKCKFRRGTIRLEGSFGEAMAKVAPVFRACVDARSASGPNSNLAASGPNSNLAASGLHSNLAASGECSNLAASGQYSKLAASGQYSNLAASGENCCCATANADCRVKVGPRGAFALPYWTEVDGWRFLTGKVGENGIEANVWYRVENGKIVRAE